MRQPDRVIRGTVLLLLSSMAALQVWHMVGLPAALLHSSPGEVPYKPCHVVFEAESWMLDQEIYVRSKAVQGEY